MTERLKKRKKTTEDIKQREKWRDVSNVTQLITTVGGNGGGGDTQVILRMQDPARGVSDTRRTTDNIKITQVIATGVVFRLPEFSVDPFTALIPRMPAVVRVYLLWDRNGEADVQARHVWEPNSAAGIATSTQLRRLDRTVNHRTLRDKVMTFDSPPLSALEYTEATLGVTAFVWGGQCQEFELIADVKQEIAYEPGAGTQGVVAGGAFYLCAVCSATANGDPIQDPEFRITANLRIRFHDI